jgi:acetyl esterase
VPWCGPHLDEESAMSTSLNPAPGRLGDPELTLATDPRADPRMVAVFSAFGIAGHADGAPLSPAAPREELLGFVDAVEGGFEGLFTALAEGSPPLDGVTSELVTITGEGGHEIRLHVHRPSDVDGPLPCVYQVHGGGMVMLSTVGPLYTRWRDELAAAGNVVVGVEYRNGAGVLGAHPFPAGLDDAAAGLRWVAAHLGELGASHIVVTGDSGGANLALALAIKAKREGWVGEIAGSTRSARTSSGTGPIPICRRCARTTSTGSTAACSPCWRRSTTRRARTPTTPRAGRTTPPSPTSRASRRT